MLSLAHRETIMDLYNKGISQREIGRTLKVSRNAVKAVIESGGSASMRSSGGRYGEIIPLIRELYMRCRGNAVRMREILKSEYGKEIAYSTLTFLVKKHDMRAPVKRVGDYVYEPGQEMQHDTSPHKVLIGGKLIKLQCASLVLAYSRYIFMQYYPCFTHFEAKIFLKAAFEDIGGLAHNCIIDNTNVVLASGSGSNAVICAEMLVFCRMFGFKFIAHNIGHSDRKACVERPFRYIEGNFLAGREFKDIDDLNKQAKEWCIAANNKEKRRLNKSPDMALLQERPYLITLPPVMPPIYEHCQRYVDSQAYINLDTNRYSVPQQFIGKPLDVYKYSDVVRINYQGAEIAVHPRLSGKRNDISRIEGHHIQIMRQKINHELQKAEESLQRLDPLLDDYIKLVKRQVRGAGARHINRLLAMSRTYPSDAFIKGIKQANQYGLVDLHRLERLILEYVSGEYFKFGTDNE